MVQNGSSDVVSFVLAFMNQPYIHLEIAGDQPNFASYASELFRLGSFSDRSKLG